jgi:hypothetical protein
LLTFYFLNLFLQGAYSLSPADKLSKSLLQVTGPTHIPYHDSKWQQLLLNYEQLVHLHNLRLTPEDTSENGAAEEEGDVIGKACRRCAKHCSTSSNLAALSLHVARMIGDLQGSISELTTAYHQKYQQYESVDETNMTGVKPGGEMTKQRIVLIGKARATCGAINVLRLFTHETIVQACRDDNVAEKSTLCYEGQSASKQDVNYILKESFTYRSRNLNSGMDSKIDGQDAALDLISSIMSFLSNLGKLMSTEGSNTAGSSENFDSLSIPEVYDVVLQILSLLLVLLSTQLYQPMISSAQLAEVGQTTSNHYFLERIMDYALWQRQNSRQSRRDGVENLNGSAQHLDNEALLLLNSCFQWMIHRPPPPKRSIASHYLELTNSIAHQLPNMAISQDGMYENHSVVMSTLPTGASSKEHTQTSLSGAASHGSSIGLNEQQVSSFTAISLGTDDQVGISSPGHVTGTITTRTSSKLLLPIKSILLLSSSLFLLPIRLVKLAFRVLGHSGQRALLASKHSDISSSDHAALQHLQSYCEKATGWDMTNNILWISDSPVADLSSALILLLSNNFRANLESGSTRQRSLVTQNPFRSEMASLSDTRWNGDLPSSEHATSLFPSDSAAAISTVLSVDFESLFDSFGRITHTEIGALMLYTVMQSSPIFAASLMARSDLDTLVMPLLRTLYFSSKLAHEASHGQVSPFITLAQKDRPFRAQSQLYIILILLLIFSQDPSFGRDVFRRVSIPKVAWYKERQVKDISLGSMLILVLVKAITFNLNRLQDEFLLSNCIAVLLNLSPHTVNLHSYVSSRLVSVTVSCFKRYAALVKENNGQVEQEGDMSTMQGMHGEVSIC